eukprot:gene8302-biopygen12127
MTSFIVARRCQWGALLTNNRPQLDNVEKAEGGGVDCREVGPEPHDGKEKGHLDGDDDPHEGAAPHRTRAPLPCSAPPRTTLDTVAPQWDAARGAVPRRARSAEPRAKKSGAGLRQEHPCCRTFKGVCGGPRLLIGGGVGDERENGRRGEERRDAQHERDTQHIQCHRGNGRMVICCGHVTPYTIYHEHCGSHSTVQPNRTGWATRDSKPGPATGGGGERCASWLGPDSGGAGDRSMPIPHPTTTHYQKYFALPCTRKGGTRHRQTRELNERTSAGGVVLRSYTHT